MKSSAKHPLLGNLAHDLKLGLEVLLFQRRYVTQFHASIDQAIVVWVILLAENVLANYVLNQPNPIFNYYALPALLMPILVGIAAAYVFDRQLFEYSAFRLTLNFFTSVAFWPAAIFILFAAKTDVWWEYYEFVYAGLGAWFSFAVLNILVSRSTLGNRKAATLFLILTSTSLYVVDYAGRFSGSIWYVYNDESDFEEKITFDAEELIYRQIDTTNQMLSKLAVERPGVVDMYFIGFAGWASQDVFYKEVVYTQALFDRSFDTSNRSIILANNLISIEQTPLATASNLKYVLREIGQLMNPDEDILFLYMTSHGSRNHELSVSFKPLPLNQVTPEFLRSSLEEAGIQYRVIMISACYSGGFIEPLKNDYSLVATAAAPDKRSFGCSHQNDFTYYGEAVIRDQLAHGTKIIPGIEKGIEAVNERELKEEKTPSNPMLFVGDRIKSQLEIFEAALR